MFAVSELLLVQNILLELIPALLQPLGSELALEELADLLHLPPLDALGMQVQEEPPQPMPTSFVLVVLFHSLIRPPFDAVLTKKPKHLSPGLLNDIILHPLLLLVVYLAHDRRLPLERKAPHFQVPLVQQPGPRGLRGHFRPPSQGAAPSVLAADCVYPLKSLSKISKPPRHRPQLGEGKLLDLLLVSHSVEVRLLNLRPAVRGVRLQLSQAFPSASGTEVLPGLERLPQHRVPLGEVLQPSSQHLALDPGLMNHTQVLVLHPQYPVLLGVPENAIPASLEGE